MIKIIECYTESELRWWSESLVVLVLWPRELLPIKKCSTLRLARLRYVNMHHTLRCSLFAQEFRSAPLHHDLAEYLLFGQQCVVLTALFPPPPSLQPAQRPDYKRAGWESIGGDRVKICNYNFAIRQIINYSINSGYVRYDHDISIMPITVLQEFERTDKRRSKQIQHIRST